MFVCAACLVVASIGAAKGEIGFTVLGLEKIAQGCADARIDTCAGWRGINPEDSWSDQKGFYTCRLNDEGVDVAADDCVSIGIHGLN